jgi:hypothetical protein
VTAAVVLGTLYTAAQVVSVGSVVFVAINQLRKPIMDASVWWLVQLVGSAAVRAAWTALVSYVVVQVCRRVVAAPEASTR